jgi:hypothetical protein
VIFFETLNNTLIRRVLLAALHEYGYDLNRTFPSNTPIEWLADYFNRRRPRDQAFITPLDCINHMHSTLPNSTFIKAYNRNSKALPNVSKVKNSTEYFRMDQALIRQMWRAVVNESIFIELVNNAVREYDLVRGNRTGPAADTDDEPFGGRLYTAL